MMIIYIIDLYMMIDLKQYIEESLLDDFNIISDDQDKLFKDPFAYLCRNGNTSNWGSVLNEFEEVIKLGSKEDHKNIKEYYGLYLNNPIKHGQVHVWIASTSTPSHPDKVIVLLSDADLKPMRDSDYIGEGKYYLTISPNRDFGGITIAEALNLPYIHHIKQRYILSKELSKSAINMVKLVAKGEWGNYWGKL